MSIYGPVIGKQRWHTAEAPAASIANLNITAINVDGDGRKTRRWGSQANDTRWRRSYASLTRPGLLCCPIYRQRYAGGPSVARLRTDHRRRTRLPQIDVRPPPTAKCHCCSVDKRTQPTDNIFYGQTALRYFFCMDFNVGAPRRQVSVYIDHVDAVQSAICLSYSLLSIWNRLTVYIYQLMETLHAP